VGRDHPQWPGVARTPLAKATPKQLEVAVRYPLPSHPLAFLFSFSLFIYLFIFVLFFLNKYIYLFFNKFIFFY
jgi:hypothetical protein